MTKHLPKQIISPPYAKNQTLVQKLKKTFDTYGYVKLSDFLIKDVFNLLAFEVKRLHSMRVRKDFIMPNFDTDRHMSVLSGKEVVRQSTVIADFYAHSQLREWITHFMGQPIYTAFHEDEFLVINFLDGQRDTHGWHLDDPRYALIVIIENPPVGMGGCIEYIPKWKEIAQKEGFDPQNNVTDGVSICKEKHQLYSDNLQAGDCYLLDAAEVLHRVSPMHLDGQRKALNFAFDDRCYRIYGETAKKLYA